MSRAPVIASVVCALGAAIGGYFMVPGNVEQVAMLARDGQDELAVVRAEDLFAQGNREPKLLMQAFVLHARNGEFSTADRFVDEYFRQLPDDSAAWKMVAAIFADAGRAEQERNALENVLRLTPDMQAARRLSIIYRLKADEVNELRILESLDDASLEEPDALRLVHLLLVRGRTSDAILLLDLLESRGFILSDESRLRLFVALIDQGRFVDAVNRALAWKMTGKNEYSLNGVFVSYLVRAGADEAALTLATSLVSFADARSMAHVAHLFSDEGRYDLLERIVCQWLADAKTLPVSELDDYVSQVVSIARAKGLGNSLLSDLMRALAAQDSTNVLASYVQAVYLQVGYAGIAPLRSTLPPSIFYARPVLAAALFTAERNVLLARRFLLAAHLPSLSASEQYEWLRLAQEVLEPAELTAEITHRARLGAIPRNMARSVLEVVLYQGSQPQTVVVWRSLFARGKPTGAAAVSGPLIGASIHAEAGNIPASLP